MRCSKYPSHNNRKWGSKHINAYLRKRNQILSIKISTTSFSCITVGSLCEISIRNEKDLKLEIKKLKIHEEFMRTLGKNRIDLQAMAMAIYHKKILEYHVVPFDVTLHIMRRMTKKSCHSRKYNS